MTFDAVRFAEWVGSLHLRYFTAAELAESFVRSRGKIKNEPPPEALWVNLAPTLAVLDEFRHGLGAPVRLHSTYRTEAYNRAVGGEPKSQHKEFRAIDFSSKKGTPAEWGTTLRMMRTAGLFKGGVGIYPRSGFVHVDTRGRNADWLGK